MRNLPLIFQTSAYKYTIIARLSTLSGAESRLKKRKTELINHLKRKGYPETSIKRWLIIEKEERTEMPAAALLTVLKWFNTKYREQKEVGFSGEIHLEDLFHPELRMHNSQSESQQ
jgi:hypothetical protein